MLMPCSVRTRGIEAPSIWRRKRSRVPLSACAMHRQTAGGAAQEVQEAACDGGMTSASRKSSASLGREAAFVPRLAGADGTSHARCLAGERPACPLTRSKRLEEFFERGPGAWPGASASDTSNHGNACQPVVADTCGLSAPAAPAWTMFLPIARRVRVRARSGWCNPTMKVRYRLAAQPTPPETGFEGQRPSRSAIAWKGRTTRHR